MLLWTQSCCVQQKLDATALCPQATNKDLETEIVAQDLV